MRTVIFFFFLVIQVNGFCQAPVFPFRDGELWGVVDGNLKEIVEPVYHQMKFFVHFESEHAVEIVTDMSGYKGLINRKGEELLHAEYRNLMYTYDENGVVLYQTYPEKKYGLYSVLQKKIVVSLRYDEAPATLHLNLPSLLLVKQNGKYGVVRTDGSSVVPIQYEHIKPFSIEKCPWIAARNENKVVYYDCKGAMHTEKPVTSFEVSDDDLEFVSIGGETSMAETKQSNMSPVTQQLVNQKLGEGAAIQSQFQNRSGEHFAIVRVNAKTGILDGKGITRIPFEYDEIKASKDFGGLLVVKNGLQGWIDITPMKVIIKPAYSKLYNPFFKFGELKAIGRYAAGEMPPWNEAFIELKTGKVFYPVRK